MDSSGQEFAAKVPDRGRSSRAEPPRRFFWSLLGVCFLLCASVVAFGLNGLYQSERQRIAQAEVRSRNMAEAVDKTLSAMIDKVDLALLQVIDELESDLHGKGIMFQRANENIARQMRYVPSLEGIRASNAAGEVIFGTGVERPGEVAWTDRDFFISHRDHADRGLQVTQPVFGRVAKQWVISFNRRYNMPDGSFAGVVSATVPVEHLRSLMARFDMGPGGVINIRGVADQKLVVRYPEVVNGRTLPIGDGNVSDELKALLAAGERGGTYHGVSPYDHTARTFTFHQLENAPFVVVAGLADADYLADWYVEREITLGLLAGFLLLTALGARVIWVLWRRQAVMAGELRESNLGLADARAELEQRVAEQTARLAEANHKLSDTQFAMDSVGIGIHWVDADSGRFIYANKFAANLLGYSVEEFVALGVPDIDPAFRWDNFRELTAIIRENGSWQLETTNRTRDGRLIPVEAIIYYFPGGDGEAARFITFLKDITARREAAQALLEAKESAEAASLAKSTFLANMSHEIRTPMNAIVGFTHMLRQDVLTPLQAERVGRIATATEHLLAVISDILDLSKIEAGKLELESVEFDLNAMIESVAAIIVLRTQAKGVELVLDIVDLPQYVVGDPTRLRQVLLNYLGNAAKFTERGSIVLRGRRVRDDERQVTLRFEVEDTGIGIRPEQIDQLFSPFSQADSSTTRSFGGTGLGLAISKHIVEMMDGQVGVTSQPGVGSTFWLNVRFGLGKAAPAPAAPLAMPGKRVLVADDVRMTRLILARLLEQLGWQAEVAASGQEAVACVLAAEQEGRPFSLVLVDLRMPGMDGMKVMGELDGCALQDPPDCVLITATSDAELVEAARRAGFVDVLAKPISHAMLRSWFEARGNFRGQQNVPVENARQALRRYVGARILLAEDEAINQLIAREMLEDLGLQVILANDGEQAVALVAEQNFDLILSDMQMPVMDGLEAARRIRQLPLGQRVPIIAMTANAFTEDRARCLAAGMNDFLTKPVDPEALFSTLAKWLAIGSAARA